MGPVGYLLALAAILVAVVCLVALWRFVAFRNRGSQGLLRRLPATGLHGWRHGVFRYSGESLKFYQLRSLALTVDVVMDRRRIHIAGSRDLSEDERDFMPGRDRAVVLTTPKGDYEFASDAHTQMALVSWIESAPDVRQVISGVRPCAQRAKGRQQRS